MGRKPTPQHSLDRIDNSLGYFPKNCKWSTKKEQALNTRNIDKAARYTFDGKTLTINEWSTETGIGRAVLAARIQRLEWNVERALTTPTRKHKVK